MTLWPAPSPTHRIVGWCARCRSPKVREWFWGPVRCRCPEPLPVRALRLHEGDDSTVT